MHNQSPSKRYRSGTHLRRWYAVYGCCGRPRANRHTTRIHTERSPPLCSADRLASPRLTSCTGSDYRNGTKSLATALAALVIYSSATTLQEDPERVHGKGREGRRAEGSETKIVCALSPPLPQPHASFDGCAEASDVAWTLNDPPLRPDPIILPCTTAQSRASTISKRSVRRLSGTAVCCAGNVHIHFAPTISTPRPLTIVLAPRTAPQLRDIQA
jgi:hypothetical protein